MRIVIELKRGEVPEVVLNNLYKHTQLQTTLRHHHARDRRRPAEGADAARARRAASSSSAARSSGAGPSSSCARPRRARTSSRACKIALDHLDAVIALIRGSKTPAEARDGLMSEFGLSPDPGAGDPRHAAPAADRPRAAEDPRRARRAAEDDRAAARDPRERRAADADRSSTSCARCSDEVRRRAAHRDRRGRGRARHRGPDRRRGHGDHGQRHRLHQADGDLRPTARSAAAARAASACGRGRGLRQPPLRRLDARLHHDLLGPRPRLLAEGPRDPGRRAGGKGKAIANLVSMEPNEKIAALLAVQELRGRQVRRDGHPPRASSRRPSSPRSATRARAASSRWASRRATRSSPSGSPTGTGEIFIGTRERHGDPLRRERRAADGPHGLRRPRHLAAGRRRRSSRWRSLQARRPPS